MRILTLASFLLFLYTHDALKLESRIIGGFAAKRGQYPFYVFLVQKSAQKNVTWCGGSLISDQFVLTAAHCTQPAEKIALHLGTWKAKHGNETGRIAEIVRRKNVYIHPNYNAKYLINDISLIKLKQSITLTANIQPIRLQGTCQSNDNAKVIAIGNGYHSRKYPLAPILQWTPLTTIPFRHCKSVWPFLVWHQSAICAKNSEGRAIKQGDSGGPLIRDHVLIGLASFAPFNKTDSSKPQGFVDLIKYHGWIAGITEMNLTICTFPKEINKSQ